MVEGFKLLCDLAKHVSVPASFSEVVVVFCNVCVVIFQRITRIIVTRAFLSELLNNLSYSEIF